MKKLLVLGAGSAGTMIANRMNRMLDRNEWQITIVDPDPVHYYQPGFLFMPFGIYNEKDVYKPRKQYLPGSVNYIQEAVEIIEPGQNQVRLASGALLPYDYLVIATGANIYPEETLAWPNMNGESPFTPSIALTVRSP
jgi:sulfide:quinone oxidoreductase